MRGIVRSACVGALALLLAGCSGGSGYRFGASVVPSTTTEVVASSASPADEPEDAAPKVTDPLDVDRVLDDPCEALGDAQLSSLGFSGPGEPDTSAGQDQCNWWGTGLYNVTIRPLVSTKDGLSDIYEHRDAQAYFEPTTIGGYPAVYASALDERDKGDCVLLVGVRDDLAISVTTSFLEVEPCPVVERTAEAMIEHVSDGA